MNSEALQDNKQFRQKNEAANRPKILCVDDEQQILSSLKRLFRRKGYDVATAESGAAGLQMLESGSFDLIISDMRMPNMNGAEFLAKACASWPETNRILLTGYADLKSSVAAINEGKIFRYISKPWNEEELLRSTEQAIEQARLKATVRAQNEELKKLNKSLEEKVKDRTQDLQKAVTLLKKSNGNLKRSYHETVAVFASVIDLRKGVSVGQGRRAANLAKSIAEHMKLEASTVEHTYFAGLLHQIGKIGLADDIFNTPYAELNKEQLEQLHKYPQTGEVSLALMDQLKDTATIIRSHRERFDGEGYPDKIKGTHIPIGARILNVAIEYLELQNGMLLGNSYEKNQAYQFVVDNKETRYDPDVVEAFEKIVQIEQSESARVEELKLSIHDLRSGMILNQDITLKTGMLLVRKGQELHSDQIGKIQNLRNEIDGEIIHVCFDKGDKDV